MTDSKGNDAIYFEDEDAFPIFGHAALLFQDAEGNWYKTQFYGNYFHIVVGIITSGIALLDYLASACNNPFSLLFVGLSFTKKCT